MRIWNQVPLFRLFVPFTAGILLQIFLPLNLKTLLFFLAVSLVACCLFTFVKKLKANWKYKWLYGLAINLTMIFTGILLTYSNTDRNVLSHFKNETNVTEYIAVLTDQLHEKKNSFKTTAKIESVKNGQGKWMDVTGNVLLYLEKDSVASALKYGDEVIFYGVPKIIEEPKNPEEFNYKRFLSFHNIYHQVYLKGGKWASLNRNEGYAILRFSFDLRDRLMQIFRTSIIRDQEVGVASALVLGYTDNIDAELINAYASAGALHVLSVSGMHVGIIFIVFNGMLVWMDRNKYLRHLKFFILLSFIWFYAMLTGFSPAVLRSAMMISVIIIGKWINGNTNMFNTLIVSAFLLLCFNPYLITEVGFQLSYLAVFGIVYLNPMIVKWLEPSNWLLFQLWQITSVSISAQVMTFPLGLLYFHQFPNLFFISNLIVIPLSTVIIYMSIALLGLSFLTFIPFVSVISFYVSVASFGLLYILNNTVLFVERIPYAVMQGVSITIFETWIIYLIMFTALFFILYKRAVYLQTSLFLLAVLLFGQVTESYEIAKQKKMVVYAISKKGAYDFIDGDRNYFIADTNLVNDKSRMMFHVIHNWWQTGTETTEFINTFNTNYESDNIAIHKKFIQFYDKRIAVVDYKFILKKNLKPYDDKIKLDYLLLSGNNYQSIKNISGYFDFKKIIIDGSYTEWRAKKIAEECRQLHIDCYSVPQQGAFVLTI